MAFLALGIVSWAFFLEIVPEQKKEPIPVSPMPVPLRGVHVMPWVIASERGQKKYRDFAVETKLNALVIAIKESNGEVYIPGVPNKLGVKSYVPTLSDWPAYLKSLKDAGLYTIARMVVFKDDKAARARPDLAILRPDGSLWTNNSGTSWVDPYRKEIHDYNLDIAQQAVALGFQEVQLDYIRFPSDGPIKQCRYSYEAHDSTSALRCLEGFLDEARERLKPLGANVSICVFGLTTSAPNDMGIGQRISEMSARVDAVSPMIYPSHYAKGEYGIPDPDAEPYKTVYKSIQYAIRKMGPESSKLRPYLQAFSLRHHYGPPQVRAQVKAAEEQGVTSWLLWSSGAHYVSAAFSDKTLPASPSPILETEPTEPSQTYP